MRPRIELHRMLCNYCKNVYFQPPESLKLKYPCIIYSRSKIDTDMADNLPYLMNCSYEMVYVTEDPDDPLVFELARLPMCRHGRHYANDNLHHDSYTIYY